MRSARALHTRMYCEVKARKNAKIFREEKSERTFKPFTLTDEEPLYAKEQGGHNEKRNQVKRIGMSHDNCLYLAIPENAVARPTVSALLDHVSPIVSLEIEGEPKRPIVDTGLNISILQPGVSG